MYPENLPSFIINLVIFSGCILNVAYITNLYMKFETKTNEASSTRDELTKPQVSLCYDMLTLLTKKDRRPSVRAFRTQMANRSMGEMFLMVPAASESLSHCSYRDFDRDIIIHQSNGSECASIFKVTRYRIQNYMCYSYDLSYDGNEYRFHQVTRSLNSPRLQASLTVNSPLNTGDSVYPLVRTVDRIAMQDRIFNRPVYISRKRNQLFKLNYYEFETTRLPPPYQTQCSSGGSPTSCHFTCRNDLYSQQGLIPESSFTEELNETNHLRFPAYDHPHQGHRLREISKLSRVRCSSKCTRPACHEVLVKTSVSQSHSSDFKLTFEIETIKYPLSRVVHSPKYNLWVFLTEVITLLAIWTGFSICSCFMMVHLRPHFRRMQAISLEDERVRLARNIQSKFPTSRLVVPSDLFREKASKKTLKKVLLLCLVVFSLICLSIQLCNLLFSYFLYKVDMVTTHISSPAVRYPSISLCLDVQFIFNKPLVLEVEKDSYEEDYDALDVTANYSLNEMFDRAAKIPLIKGCALRNWTDFDMPFIWHRTREKCLQKFNHSQLFIDSQMCFRFKPSDHHNSTLRTSYLQFQSNELPGIMYIMDIDMTRLRKLVSFRVMLDYEDLPYDSMRYKSFAFITREPRTFIVSALPQSISYLPAPYETNCIPGREHKACLSDCLQKSMARKLNLLPVKQMIVERSPLRIISFGDLKQQHTYLAWQQIQRECHSHCSRWACEYSAMKTHLTHTYHSSDQLAFAVAIPSRPLSLTHTVARMTLYGLLFNLMCSISFWTGFTFISFAPISSQVKQDNSAINRVYLRCERLVIFINHILKKEPSYDIDYFLQFARQVYHICDVKSRFIYLLCAVGCSVHLTWALSAYLSYPTNMNTGSYHENSSNYSLSLCMESDHFIPDFHSKMDQLTEHDLFNQTPGTEIIQSCTMRGLGSPEAHVSDKILFRYKNATECHSMFRVTKYIIDSNICYQFTPIHHEISIEGNLNLDKYLYAISVNSSLLSKRYRVTISDGDSIPRLSINWAHRAPSPPVMKAGEKNHHLVTYQGYEEAVASYPYDDNGMVPGLISRDIESCAKKFFLGLNKIAVHSGHDLMNLTFFSPHIQNQTIHFPSVFRKCYELAKHKKYFWPNNTFRATKVLSIGPITDHQASNTKTFHVLTTDFLVVTMQLTPALTIIDLIIALGSILCLWFGLSVVSVDSSGKSVSYIQIALMKRKLKNLNREIVKRTVSSHRTRIPVPVFRPPAFQVRSLRFQRPSQ